MQPLSNYRNELLKYEKLSLDNKHTISLQNEGLLVGKNAQFFLCPWLHSPKYF